MERDSLLGERIIWTARPKVIETPGTLRAAAVILFVLSADSLCFGVTTALALSIPPTSALLFAAWTATLGLVCWQGPKIWLGRVRYIVTERHVVMQRGPFRRTIERRAISFARIFWNPRAPGVGDMDLVRAVPTGALKRKLLLQLRGVAAPDQVWAIIRGVGTPVTPHRGDRPLGQRLDEGERVLWSARAKRTFRACLPQGVREWSLLALAVMMLLTAATMVARALPNTGRLLGAGLASQPAAEVGLIAGQGLAVLLVLTTGAVLLREALILPGRRLDSTRYLITNQRVLIQRGREELHLDRSRIVDVIPAPTANGLTDVFLVLDGPRARALSVGGIFGDDERGPQLRPVLYSVEDAESISQILLRGAKRAA